MSWEPDDEQEHLSEWLRRLDSADRGVETRAALRVRTLAALEREEPCAAGGSRIWLVAATWRWWLAAASACVLLAVGAIVWRGQAQNTPSATEPFSTPNRTAAGPAAEQASKVQETAPPRPSAESSPTGSRGPRAIAIEPGLFVPIVAPWNDDGAMHMMRVRMSSSALRAFGVPVDVSYGERELHADVLVGEDGVARAIRFVRDGEGSVAEGRSW
ncbi:MAG: hypothetical protein AB7I50_05125 [Vicinamibacterales bacterium]